MQIQRVRLNQYRNYASLALSPAPGVNVIAGDNAQGKTNAVEALFLCAFARSHRTARDAELIMRECAGGYVGVELTNRTGSHTLEIRLREGERKQIFIDKCKANRSAELMGQLNVVMFSPEDLVLVKGGPAERRRFMDMEISQLRPAYFAALQQYNAALKQRNALLKSDTASTSMLTLWDEQLATLGARIMLAREGFAQALCENAGELHTAVSGGETLRTDYRPATPLAGDEADMAERLFARLCAGAEEDLRRGFTGTGPHRDDLAILLGGTDARVYGSQGQQRTAALSLKLSEIALIQRQTGETPVLLLDDVLSELDDSRARRLLGCIAGCQSFITCTGLDAMKRAGATVDAVWICEKGEIRCS